MCIAILKPAGKNISKKTFYNCYENNPDGCGYAFVDKSGKLQIIKGFFNLQDFFESFYKSQAENPHSNFLIHFRIATSGKIDSNNCHPFRINKNWVFIHNGIFSDLGDNIESDTMQFKNKIANIEDIGNPAVRFLLDKYFISEHSKGVFLNSDNEYFFCNKKAFIEDNGVFYSNNSFRPTVVGKWGKRGGQSTTYSYGSFKYDHRLYDYNTKDVNATDEKFYDIVDVVEEAEQREKYADMDYDFEDDDLMVDDKRVCPWCHAKNTFDQIDNHRVCHHCGSDLICVCCGKLLDYDDSFTGNCQDCNTKASSVTFID